MTEMDRLRWPNRRSTMLQRLSWSMIGDCQDTRCSAVQQVAKKEQLRSSSKAAWTADQKFDSDMAASDNVA